MRVSLPWRWRHVLLAPHRLGFLLAMGVLSASALGWLAVQWNAAVLPPQRLTPGLFHAALMVFGFFPLFFSGFLFTAGPKWLRVAAPAARQLAPAMLLQFAGWMLWLAAAAGQVAAATGPLLALAGLAGTTRRFMRLIAASREADRLHARAVAAALGVGCLCLAALAAACAAGEDATARLVVGTGLWGCVFAIVGTAAHRLVPFLTSPRLPLSRALGESWVLWALLAVAMLEAVAPWGEAVRDVPPAWHLARGALELAAAAGIAALAFAWSRAQSLRPRLVRMLHTGFAWLAAGLALAGANGLAAALAPARTLPLAPLHAIAMGGFGSLLLAMVTRLSNAHAGRAVAADDLTWRLFWLLQAAVLLRLGATVAAPRVLLPLAALAWAAVVVPWSARHVAGFLQAPQHAVTRRSSA